MRTWLTACFLSAALHAASITVGPNVQVSAKFPGDTHYEVLVAADPVNPSQLIVGSFLFPDDNSEASTVVYHSGDGGMTWRPTLAGEALLKTSDPAVAYGPDGMAYYVAAMLPDTGTRTMLLFRSTDFGASWDPKPSVFTYSDREYVTVDNTRGQRRGRVYVNGNNRIPPGVSDLVLFYSEDQGRTFVGPTKRAEWGKHDAGQMGNAVVASDGTVIAIVGSSLKGEKRNTLNAMTSTDGGATFTPAVEIDDFKVGGNRKGAHNNVNGQPILAIDASTGAFRDRLYAVWPDRRAGRSQILLSFSTDKGATWSPSKTVSDNPASDATDQLMPTIAVNADGVVGVMWYDRRNHADNLGWTARFTASLDGGVTFMPSVQVSESGASFDRARWTALRPWKQKSSSAKSKAGEGQSLQVSLSNFMFMGGDTSGLAATADGVFHPVWVDNHTGTPQVWTATVVVNREEAKATVSASSATRALGNDAVVELISPRHDHATGLITARLQVTNSTNHPLTGPFRVQVKSLQSALADIEVVKADNAEKGVGAEWLFAEKELAPNATSAARLVQFRLTNVKPFVDKDRVRLGLVDLKVEVYGR